jgi:hypothetical protein
LDNGHKGIIDGFGLIPASVICDPELTVSLPARLTAATGMDALSHCIEGVFSTLDNPPVEAIALDGCRRIVGAIERACSHPDDISARAEMMWGSLAGGYAMLMELGAIHGLSVPIGALHHAHHRAAVAEGGGEGLGLIDPIKPGADAGRGFRPAAGDEMVGGGEALCLKAGHRGGLGGHRKPLFQGVADIAETARRASPNH